MVVVKTNNTKITLTVVSRAAYKEKEKLNKFMCRDGGAHKLRAPYVNKQTDNGGCCCCCGKVNNVEFVNDPTSNL